MAAVFVELPDDAKPGAVVELYEDDYGLLAMVRIPAPAPEEPCSA